jgi:hypothetical protein
MLGEHKPDAVQRDFLKYTAQQIKFQLQNNKPALLERGKVKAKDRKFSTMQVLRVAGDNTRNGYASTGLEASSSK